MANAAGRGRELLRRFFPFAYGSTKHDHYKDFGWPETVYFDQLHRAYCRNSLAAAAVDKTVAKTWETVPALWENPDKPADTPLEQQIAKHFAERRIWQALMNADRRGMVGAYSGAILLLRDGLPLEEPVGSVVGGIVGLAGVIPAWEGQLQVATWDSDPSSDTYAQPLMFQFHQQAVQESEQITGKPADIVKIHPSRVLIWSEDGTVNGRSDLESGFNDLIDMEKIKGAGGEGFWKSARGAPIVEAKDGQNIQTIMQGMGFKTPDEAKEALDKKADDFQTGFDKFLMLGGLTAKPMAITLPQPKEFFETNLQSFAASMQMPVKVLIGNVTGERSSTEDAREWARTCMSRRINLCFPMIEEFVRRLVAFGLLPQKEWTVGWDSLLDATPDELLDRAVKMAGINANAKASGELIYLPDEIRETSGFAPAEEVEGWDEFLAEREERARAAAEDAQTETIPEEEP